MTEEQNQFKIVDKRSTEYPEAKMLPAVQSPMEIISQAVARGAGEKELATIERMFEFDLRVKAQVSKEEFFQDFAAFKEDPLELIADKINTHCNNNPYISVGKLLAIVNPALAKHGLIANFKIEDIQEGKMIKVTCILSHRMGHSIESSMAGEPDTVGPQGKVNKTPMHGRMSAVTYLMRTTFSAVVGIAAIDSRFDDDGNIGSGESGDVIDDDQFKNIQALLSETNTKEGFFCKAMKIESIDKMPTSMYANAVKILEGKR